SCWPPRVGSRPAHDVPRGASDLPHLADVIDPAGMADCQPMTSVAAAGIKVLVAFGTRPEAIKLAPVIARLAAEGLVRPCIVSTAQHRELLEQVQRVFDITPDHDLDLMSAGQGLCSLTARALAAIERLLEAERPD